MKVGVCTIAKMENRYIREFIEHYKSIGVDTIFLYDNNDVDGEKFEDVIKDYIDEGFVELHNYRGRVTVDKTKKLQLEAYNECYGEKKDDYDWIGFFDVDEFLTIPDTYKDIKEWLSDPKFKLYGIIQVNWMNFDDNGKIYYEDKPLKERFPVPAHKDDLRNYQENWLRKSIVRGGISPLVWTLHPHSPLAGTVACNAAGKLVDNMMHLLVYPDYEGNAYIRHYPTKTVEEYITVKMQRGYPDMSMEDASKSLKLKNFFEKNEATEEKIEAAEKIAKALIAERKAKVEAKAGKPYDYLIVGAGLYGCVFAHEAARRGKKCLVIDKRMTVGGNLACDIYEGKDGKSIIAHKYGPHIFHTSDKEVWNYVNSIVEFNNFVNSPIAIYRGRVFNLPFNMNTFNSLWGVVSPDEAKEMVEALKRPAEEKPKNLEEQALALGGRPIYETLVKGYTEKQWGRKCTELPPEIIRRLPFRFTYNNNYFDDTYQGIPKGGYEKLIVGLLAGCDLKLGVDYLKEKDTYRAMADKVVYTGPIDAYFDYIYGNLEYRTVRFETYTLDIPNFQGNAVVNYTDDTVPWTRIIEHKFFENLTEKAVNEIPFTVVTKEFPEEWEKGKEPFYPINDKANEDLYKKYKGLIANEKDVIFGGRLAEYKYYDMDKIVRNVLDYWKENN